MTTPPSLTVAREILADAAAKARGSGDPVAELAAAAIDVVLARLDEIEGLIAVHEKHLAAWCDKPAIPGEQATSIEVEPRPPGPGPMSRAERVAALRADADRIERAEPTHAEITAAPGCAEHACVRHPSCLAATVRCGCPECRRAQAAATTHGTAIPPDALVADMLPCPFCRGTKLTVGAETDASLPRVVCGACGARGPLARTGAGREAFANWNRRPAERAGFYWSRSALPPPRPPGERYLAAALRSLVVELGLTPSGTGSEDLGLLEVEIGRLRAASPTPARLTPCPRCGISNCWHQRAGA